MWRQIFGARFKPIAKFRVLNLLSLKLNTGKFEAGELRGSVLVGLILGDI